DSLCPARTKGVTDELLVHGSGSDWNLDGAVRLSACREGAGSCRGTRTARIRSDVVSRKRGPRIPHACRVTSRCNSPIGNATGIASIYARDPVTMAAGQNTLAEAYPGRFLLGLGVSHIPLVEQIRGHSYGKPLASMREYLDGMDRAPYRAVPPSARPVRVLAA